MDRDTTAGILRQGKQTSDHPRDRYALEDTAEETFPRRSAGLKQHKLALKCKLGPCIHRIRHILEAELGCKGTKEYITVLLMQDKHSLSRLTRLLTTLLEKREARSLEKFPQQ